jgi:hypothetical protein
MNQNYKKKYIKYKNKYTLLKSQLGGTKIDFNNKEPPHEIPIYREMMQKYLGITSTVINMNMVLQYLKKYKKYKKHQLEPVPSLDSFIQKIKDDNYKELEPIFYTYKDDDDDEKKQIFDYLKKIVTRDFNKPNISSYYGKDYNDCNKILQIIDYKYTLIDKIECFSELCNSFIFIFELNNELIIVFNIGTINYNLLSNVELFSKLFKHLYNSKYKKILLCGHSNGMSVATFTAIVILYIEKKDSDLVLDKLQTQNIMKKFLSNLDIELLLEKSLINKIDILDKISICGTGGFAFFRYSDDYTDRKILYSKIDNNNNQFKLFEYFFDSYEGRYLHIVSKENNIIDSASINIKVTIPSFMSYKEMYNYYINYKIAIYELCKFEEIIINDTIDKQEKNMLSVINGKKITNYETQFIPSSIHTFDYYRKMLVPFFFETRTRTRRGKKPSETQNKPSETQNKPSIFQRIKNLVPKKKVKK